MSYDAQSHRRAFMHGANEFVAKRCRYCSRSFREQVVDSATENWPSSEWLARHEPYEIRSYLLSSPEFRESLGVNPLVWWLFSLFAKAIIDALIDYWTQTETKGFQ